MSKNFLQLAQRWVLALVLPLMLAVPAKAGFHPEIDWREITSGPFIVVFPRGYEARAAETLALAGDMYGRLRQMWGGTIKNPIRILLTDHLDEANGSTTFFPFNEIDIQLFEPGPESDLGGCRDWLSLVLAHELTHLIHLNLGSRFTYFMRKIFGTNPIFFPVIYAPAWMAEGCAVYGESAIDAGGRLNTPDFSLLLSLIGQKRGIPDSAHLYGLPTDWPGPLSWYLYGGKFAAFLAENYGEKKLKEIMTDFGRRFIPQVIEARFLKVFGKSLSYLWAEFSLASKVPDPGPAAQPGPLRILTRKGMIQSYPVFGPGDQIYFFSQDFREFPGLYRLDIPTLKTGRVVEKADFTGLSFSTEEQKIYFSAHQYFKFYYRFSDLYELDLKTDKVKRLTCGRRLSWPVRAGEVIYCIKRQADRSFIARFKLGEKTESIISPGYVSLSHLALSPDGHFLAASIKQKGKNWAIGIFTAAGEPVHILPDSGGKNFCPQWKDNQELYYIAEYGNNYRLASFNLLDRRMSICRQEQLPPIYHVTLAEDKGLFLVTFLDAYGENLGLINISDLVFEPLAPGAAEAGESAPAAPLPQAQPVPDRPYRPWRELLPKYWLPAAREGGQEMQAGIYLSGQDLVQKHAYELAAYYGPRSGSLNLDFRYLFQGLFPGLAVRFYTLTDRLQDGAQEFTHREDRLELTARYPLFRGDAVSAYLQAGIHTGKITDQIAGLSPFRLNGIKLGFLYSSARRYYDAISEADGFSLDLAYERELGFMGSDFDIDTLRLDFRHYMSLLRPNVLGLRLAAAHSWGEAQWTFPMGGHGSDPGVFTSSRGLFDLMRAYDSGSFWGTGGFLVNLEYRIGLFKIERVFTVIQSLDRLYLSLFADIGNVWYREIKIDPAVSLGAELNLLCLIGDMRFNLCGGLAFGMNPHRKATFFFRLGHAF